MRYGIYNFIGFILRQFGLKTTKLQFVFSFSFILLFAVFTAVSLYMTMGSNPAAINLAGSQRMISQRVAKEAMLVVNKLEKRSTVEESIAQFDATHDRLIKGDAVYNINPINNTEVLAQLEVVKTHWQDYKNHINRYIDSGEGLEKIHTQSPVMLREMNKAVVMMTDNANDNIQFQQLIALLGTVATIVLVVLTWLGLSVFIEKIDLVKKHIVLVSQGDFTHPIDVTYADDEIGMLDQSYNELLRRIGNIMQGVMMSASRVKSGAENVSATLVETEYGVQKQHSALAEVSTATNDMVETVQEVARIASSAAESAEKANTTASDGRAITEKAIAVIKELASQLDDTSGIMHVLETDSQEVGKVLEVINNIAEQTNLLALNAAIEAARAGEQGRGFAVVADEVRTLAQRTQDSTQEIRMIIERLQQQSVNAVGAMKVSIDKTSESVEQSGKVGQALHDIAASVTQITEMSRNIANSAGEQTHVAEDIGANIQSIASVADRTTAVTADSVHATEEIGREINKLCNYVNTLKTEVKGVDLEVAKAAHLAWKRKLRDFLDGKGELTMEQAVSHHDCALGKWYYGEGLQQYGNIAEMREVEAPHAEMHALIREIISLREQEKFDEAEARYAKVTPLSSKIVSLLEDIELKTASL